MRGPRVFDGETGYRAYGEVVGWVTIDGLALPEWVDLSVKTQTLWHSAVVGAVLEAFEEPDFED